MIFLIGLKSFFTFFKLKPDQQLIFLGRMQMHSRNTF